MPPSLALFLTSLFIAYLFARDYKQEPNISGAVWIPTIYLLLLGSRSVSSWLGLGSSGLTTAEDVLEGSPVDALVFAALMFAAFVVLWNRHLPWGNMIRSNAWL